MAEAILGDHDQYSCSICLELLRDPVTIPCGHSYCMSCINECWNTNDQKGKYRCPQCRHTFNSKPPLNRSTVLAEIMEKLRSTESAQSLLNSAGHQPSRTKFGPLTPDLTPGLEILITINCTLFKKISIGQLFSTFILS
uniref:RING-type domain-containing protein n=1 Tax=Sinocyclocheilus grahami TaxID=75366 RepID=A0A672PEG5_SINGR